MRHGWAVLTVVVLCGCGQEVARSATESGGASQSGTAPARLSGIGAPHPPPAMVTGHTAQSADSDPLGALGSVPLMPDEKVDETVRGGALKRGSTTFKVLGICEYDEETVGCWDVAGKPQPDLTAKVESKLVEMTSKQEQMGAIPWEFGKLNRIMVTESSTDAGGGQRLHYEKLEGGRSSSTAMFDDKSMFKPDQPMVHRQMLFFTAEEGAKNVGVILQEVAATKGTLNLELKPGASASEEALSAKILSLEEKKSVGHDPGLSGIKRHEMKIQINGLGGRKQPSLRLRYKPQQAAPNTISKTSMRPMHYPGNPFIRKAEGNNYMVELYFSPKEVEGLTISAFERFRYRLEGLPVQR